MNEVPPGEPLGDDLQRAQHHRGLPVALGAEAVAVGHQPLHRQPGQLAQPAEVLEVGGERAEPAAVEERTQAELDARAVAERLVALAAAAQLVDDVVALLVLGDERVDVGVGGGVHRVDEIVDAPGVDGDAEPHLGLDLVALGDRDLAHVVAEAGELERAQLGQPASPRAPTSRSGPPPPDRRRGRRPSCAARPTRLSTWANSRSPWAAWLRFMKSMSISAHGSSTLACVCRCNIGFCSAWRPLIHIFAGENVCIHVITPMQRRIGVDLEHLAMDRVLLLEHRLEHDRQRDRAARR